MITLLVAAYWGLASAPALLLSIWLGRRNAPRRLAVPLILLACLLAFAGGVVIEVLLRDYLKGE